MNISLFAFVLSLFFMTFSVFFNDVNYVVGNGIFAICSLISYCYYNYFLIIKEAIKEDRKNVNMFLKGDEK